MKKDKGVIVFATFVYATAIAYIAAITFLPIQAGAEKWVNIVLGFITGTVAATPIGFVLGSSKGSADKTAMLKPEPPDREPSVQ